MDCLISTTAGQPAINDLPGLDRQSLPRTIGNPHWHESTASHQPDGLVLAMTKTEEEEQLVADLDMSLITKMRTFADAAGHCGYLS